MLKQIDRLGRVVVPKTLRKEIGVELNEYVEVNRVGNNITISKVNSMLSEEAIRHLYKTWQEKKTDTEYDRGFGDALKLMIGDETNEGR